MKTKNFFMSKAGRYVLLLAMLSFGVGQIHATSCDLKVWDKSKSAYVTWRTISDGYVFGTYDYPFYDNTYEFFGVVAWTPSPYNDTYPSSKWYYYDTQEYGHVPKGESEAYKPTTLYAVYREEDHSGYTSAPDYQLYIPTIMITYRLTGLTLTSGPHGFDNYTTTSFDAYFSANSGYDLSSVTGSVCEFGCSYLGSGINVSYSSGHLNYNPGYAITEDVIVTLTAAELSCDVLTTPDNLSANCNYESGGKTYVKMNWECASDVTNAESLKFSWGAYGAGASFTKDDVSTSATYYGKLRSEFSNGKYWFKVQALGDGDDYCDSEEATAYFCIDAIGSATPSGISATPTSTTTATITWDAVSDAAYYDIEVKNNSTNAVVCSDETDETTFNATSLAVNTEYRVELKAFNACDEGSVKSTSYTFTIVQYTVHWYVNGETWEGSTHGSPATTVLSGARPSPLPTAPDAGDFCGSAFMGWTDHEITGGSGQPSPLFKTIAPVATGNVNFYAVFADENP